MKKNLLPLIYVLIGILNMSANVYMPKDLQNPNVADRRVYVADPDHLVGEKAKSLANNALWHLRQTTGVEAVIVVVPDTGGLTEEEYATELFTSWGVGKSDKDNGILVLLVPGQRSARIAMGYGVEGVIPDISARKIINRSIVPYMKDNDVDGAVMAVAEDLSQILSDPDVAAELKSGRKERWEEMPESDITTEDIFLIIICLAGAIFLFSMGKYFYDSSRFKKQDRYRQALGWHNERSLYILFSILSLGVGLLPFLLAERKYRRARNKPIVCSTCKGKMHKLNEEEDNQLLSASQDLEERLNTVDYDVWVCDRCGSVERYPFRTSQTTYEECPNCHTVAMSMIRDHTLVPPTTRHAGMGEKIYECKYCKNKTNRRYNIPKKEDGAAIALGAATILGSGRPGGGGFGGGFGGGRTGGGGATGRW